MTVGAIFVFIIKAVVVVMFGMNLGVVLTWVDRRQGAVIADRVGPNRAVMWLPRAVAQALAVLPALAIAAGVIAYVVVEKPLPADRTDRAVFFSQLAIFFIWATGLVIARRVDSRGVRNSFDGFIQWIGDPRRIFYAGLAAHAVSFVVAVVLKGTPPGRQIRDFAYFGGAAVLAATILFGAFYSAYSVRNDERVGIRLIGLLHPAADGLKTLFKEDFVPPGADRLLHALAPIISFFPALVVMAVVPFGDTLCFATKNGQIDYGHLIRMVPADGVCVDGAVKLQGLDLNVGILYFFAMAGTGIVGAALAGWSSDNKFSLLGGLRASSQMVSYEVAMGLTIIGTLMIYGTLRLDDMVRWQAEHTWGIFVQPLAFFLFFAAAVAESKRIPFDLPEGESEIVAGYYTEYSGMKFAMFFFAEYVTVVTASALMTTLFFGGWHVPFLFRDGFHVVIGNTLVFTQPLTQIAVVLIGVCAFIFKVCALCWLQINIRWTLPRFRYDQLMRLGWRKLLPAALLNILATGLVILALQSGGASTLAGLDMLAHLSMVVVAAATIGLAVWLVLFLIKPVKKRRMLASTSAQFAAARGGTRSARMGA